MQLKQVAQPPTGLPGHIPALSGACYAHFHNLRSKSAIANSPSRRGALAPLQIQRGRVVNTTVFMFSSGGRRYCTNIRGIRLAPVLSEYWIKHQSLFYLPELFLGTFLTTSA